MFHQDLKAKRKSKIKSKSYRKILRLEKLKHSSGLGDELDDADPEAAQEYREKLDKQRIIV